MSTTTPGEAGEGLRRREGGAEAPMAEDEVPCCETRDEGETNQTERYAIRGRL